jgi:hypothetical protein
MNLFRFISLPIFIVSLAIGILLVYLQVPKHKLVYIYPTPENLSKVQWKDKADKCYTWDQLEVSCPDNAQDIQPIPIQN